MDRKADMLRGAELMTQAFFDSATSKDGMSFGAVVDRFCELSGIDRSTYGVLCVLHHAGGLTVNNAIGDDYRPCDCDQMDVCPTGRCVPDSAN
jgi:hypothetical protein